MAIRLIILSIFFSALSCFDWVEHEKNCCASLIVHIENSTKDTITVYFSRIDTNTSNIFSFSSEEIILKPHTEASDTIDYQWVQINNCSLMCDSLLSFDMYHIEVLRGNDLIITENRLPCTGHHKDIDCNEIIYDTLVIQ